MGDDDVTWLGESAGDEGDAAPSVRLSECSVAVRSETLREALVAVASRAGWAVRPASTTSVSVTDSLVALVGEQVSRRTVLVVEPTPLGSQQGVRALGSGTVSAVIASDRPSDLAAALEGVASGWAAVPLDLVENASRLPDLTERQVAIVGAIIAGQPTKEIARGLYLSDASIKRELAGLFRGFGIQNRLSLSVVASELGYGAKRVCP